MERAFNDFFARPANIVITLAFAAFAVAITLVTSAILGGSSSQGSQIIGDSGDSDTSAFNSNFENNVIPASFETQMDNRELGPYFVVSRVTAKTTTFIYNDQTTAPCNFTVATKDIKLSKFSGASFLKFSFKPGSDQESFYSCKGVASHISSIRLQAEPAIYSLFTSAG